MVMVARLSDKHLGGIIQSYRLIDYRLNLKKMNRRVFRSYLEEFIQVLETLAVMDIELIRQRQLTECVNKSETQKRHKLGKLVKPRHQAVG